MPEPSPAAPRLASTDFLDRLEHSANRFAELASTGDLEAPVPPCPDWTLADLVSHLGEIHQWARHAVVAGNPDADLVPAPSARPALIDWYQDAAGALSGTLRATDPQTPVWTFGPKPRTASFWMRRQAHETTIHLWDAETSQGSAAPLDDTLARDGIDELISMFFPRQVRLGRIAPLAQALALEASGVPQRWVLAGDGTDPAAGPPVDATVSGPAEALLLLLWGRIGLDDPRLALAGADVAAHAVLQQALTP